MGGNGNVKDENFIEHINLLEKCINENDINVLGKSTKQVNYI